MTEAAEADEDVEAVEDELRGPVFDIFDILAGGGGEEPESLDESSLLDPP